MRIAFLGLGLIGGSIVRALRESDVPRGVSTVAWTPTGRGPTAARQAGVLDEVAPTARAAVDGADLVVLAAPPLACVELLSELGVGLRDVLKPGATVTDVASTKGSLLDAARLARVPYVGGHPMAGRETTGFEAADAGLFATRPWVVTEAVAGGDPAAVEDLARRCGGNVVHLGAEEHDRLVAAVSHLPLVAAVMLVESVAGAVSPSDDWDAARLLAATGWQDMTRLARGDPAMGAGIVVTNAGPIASRVRVLRERLDAWLVQLESPAGPDADVIESWFAAARDRLGTPAMVGQSDTGGRARGSAGSPATPSDPAGLGPTGVGPEADRGA